jgi:hypothetical protein
MPLYTFLHNLLNVLAQTANKMGLQKNICNTRQRALCMLQMSSVQIRTGPWRVPVLSGPKGAVHAIPTGQEEQKPSISLSLPHLNHSPDHDLMQRDSVLWVRTWRGLKQWHSTFFSSRASICHFSSNLYPLSCWCMIQVMHCLK